MFEYCVTPIGIGYGVCGVANLTRELLLGAAIILNGAQLLPARNHDEVIADKLRLAGATVVYGDIVADSLAVLGGRNCESRFRRVVEVDAKGNRLPADLLQEAMTHLHLQWLDLSGTGVSDADLGQLGECRSLRGLDLSRTNVTDATMAKLRSFSCLWYVDLAYTGVTDVGCIELSNAKRVKVLNLGSTSITDDGVVSLGRTLRLRVLSVDNTNIGGNGLRHLGAWRTLKALTISGCTIDSEAISRLVDQQHLESLDIRKTNVDDAAIDNLARLSRLRFIDIHQTNVTRMGAMELRRRLPRCVVVDGKDVCSKEVVDKNR